MKNIQLHSNFNFNHYEFNKYKYTDSRGGAGYNFLAYMLKGTAKIVTKGKTVIIQEGDVFYIPQNLSYQSYWYGNNKIEFISLGFLELYTKEYIGIDLQSFRANHEISESILAIPTQGTNVSANTLYRFFYAFSLVLPYLSKTTADKEKLIIELIKDTIKNHPFDSLAEIASKCNVSEPYIYSLFKKSQKYTPNEYRQKNLCDKAVNLLLTTDKPIEAIASDLNFSSSSYFRKVLKKHTGNTPSQIRKNKIF